MSNAKLRAKDLSRELDAALLGDFARLKKGSVDAQHFEQAFSSRAGQAWWDERPPDGPLGIAAKAVGSERRGETEAATSLYAEVANGSGWFRLLGLLLEGWSSAITDIEPITLAADEVRALRRSDRKARLLAKLAIFAADKGDIETAHSLWRDASSASAEDTKLGRALRVEEMNFGIRPWTLELLNTPSPGPEDDLVFPPQLEELRLRGAQGALSESLDDRLGGPWRYTIRMGITPLDEVITADLQASWIGALWIRRPIRKQMGAQLLVGAATDPSQWAHGVLMWTLGDGTHYGLALNYAEPQFDHASADFILKGVGECDPTRGRFQRLASLGAEAWDLASDDVLRWLVEEVPPLIGQGSPAEESRTIWAAFAIRLTDEWYEKYRGLDPEIKRALLDSLTPHSLRHFSTEMKATMYEAVNDDEQIVANGGALVPLVCALAPPADQERLRGRLEDNLIHTRFVADLLAERPELVSPSTEARVLRNLRKAILEQRKKARQGTTMLGGPGPRVELARMLAVARNADRSLIALLVDLATDVDSPPQYVAEARRGLVLLRRQGLLARDDLRRLRGAPNHTGQIGQMTEGLSDSVLRMLLLQILADKLTRSETAELVSAVRSHDERVRDVAVNVCAEALAQSDDEGIAWAVVSGLFDPSDSVASGALAGLGPLTERFAAAAEVAWQRLPDLLASSERQVRRQVVDAVRGVRTRTKVQASRKKRILARARQDRSWIVRASARERQR